MNMRGKVYLFLILLGMVSAAGYLAWAAFGNEALGEQSSENEAAAEADSDAIPVTVQVAERGPIAHSLDSTANLRAQREIDIAARAEGVVMAVQVEEGDAVAKGRILCSLDDRELRIDLALAEQRLAQTKIQLESAKIRREQTATQIRNKQVELDRNELALAEGLLAESEVAVERHQIEDLLHERRVTESTVRESEHRITELEAEIRKVQLQIDQTAITAPFAGRITERTVELGQTVRPTDTLFKLGAFSTLFADVHLAEHDSRLVRAGQPVEYQLGPADDEQAVGVVERISPVVDEETGTVKVTASLRPPNSAFRPGAFVRVQIQTDTREGAVLIPQQAVLEEDGETFVVVVDAVAVAMRKAVELGYQDGASVEVRSGINAGDTVVVAGQGKLKDGDKTRAVSNDEAPPPAEESARPVNSERAAMN